MTYRSRETVETVEPVDPAVAPAPPPGQVNVNSSSGYVERYSPLAPIRRVVWLLFGIVVALIGLRILLLALGANEGNTIVDAIYTLSEPLVAPFRGIFSMDQIRPTGTSEIDVAAFVAIIGWTLVAILINAILGIPDRSAA